MQRVHTSLLREPLTGGLTLGQTIDRVHRRIGELFPDDKPAQRTTHSIYEDINSLDERDLGANLKKILREIVTTMREDRSHTNKRIDELLRPPSRRTPFPPKILENINEILKWRNAASHNSRVPLGAHEADRTLYCLVSVTKWWQEQIASIDWSQSKNYIIEQLLRAAQTT